MNEYEVNLSGASAEQDVNIGSVNAEQAVELGQVISQIVFSDFTVRLTEIPGGYRLTVDRGGEIQTADILHGIDGPPGISPLVSVQSIEGGHRVIITDAEGEKSFDVMDGTGETGGVQFETDNTLKLENGILSVNTSDVVEEDNTLPVTSAAVYAEVGNINALLETI